MTRVRLKEKNTLRNKLSPESLNQAVFALTGDPYLADSIFALHALEELDFLALLMKKDPVGARAYFQKVIRSVT